MRLLGEFTVSLIAIAGLGLASCKTAEPPDQGEPVYRIRQVQLTGKVVFGDDGTVNITLMTDNGSNVGEPYTTMGTLQLKVIGDEPTAQWQKVIDVDEDTQLKSRSFYGDYKTSQPLGLARHGIFGLCRISLKPKKSATGREVTFYTLIAPYSPTATTFSLLECSMSAEFLRAQ